MLGRNVGQSNVLLQERRIGPAGHIADFSSRSVQNIVAITRYAAVDCFQTGQGAPQACCPGLLQGRAVEVASALDVPPPEVGVVGVMVVDG